MGCASNEFSRIIMLNFIIKKRKIAKKLQKFYKSERPNLRNISVSKVKRLSGGTAHNMHSFQLRYADGVRRYSEEFVIRMYPREEDAIDICRREFKIMKCLANAKIPVPYPHFMQLDKELFGMPFLIMDKVYGRTLTQESNDCSEQEAFSYFEKFIRLLVVLHSLNIYETGLDFMNVSPPPYGYADMCLQELERMLERVNSEYTNHVHEWLLKERNNMSCRHYVFVHGDYHPDNVIVRDGKIIALVDWEGAHVGDPVSDLGWTSFLLKVFGEHSIWEEDEIRDYFLEKYQELTHISLRNLKFYEVRAAAHLRLLFLLVEKYGAAEIYISQEAEQFFIDTRLLDKIDRFIEERLDN